MTKDCRKTLVRAVFQYDAADAAYRKTLREMVAARMFVRLADSAQRLADFEAAAKIFKRYIRLYYPN